MPDYNAAFAKIKPVPLVDILHSSSEPINHEPVSIRTLKATKVNGVLPMKISQATKTAATNIERNINGRRGIHWGDIDHETLKELHQMMQSEIQSAIDSETRELKEALKKIIALQPVMGTHVIEVVDIAKSALSKAGAE